MLLIYLWTFIYGVIVAASIYFIGKPSAVLGSLSFKSLISLLLDWRFLLGGVLALGARFIFVIINNLASKHEHTQSAHLTIAALATSVGILFVILANYIFLNEVLKPIQVIGAVLILIGVFLAFQ